MNMIQSYHLFSFDYSLIAGGRLSGCSLRLGFRNACAWPEKVQQTTLFDQWPEIANAQVFVTALKIRVTGDQILITPDKSMTLEDGPCEDTELGKKLNMPCIRMSMQKYIALLLGAKEEEHGILF